MFLPHKVCSFYIFNKLIKIFEDEISMLFYTFFKYTGLCFEEELMHSDELIDWTIFCSTATNIVQSLLNPCTRGPFAFTWELVWALWRFDFEQRNSLGFMLINWSPGYMHTLWILLIWWWAIICCGSNFYLLGRQNKQISCLLLY